MTNGDSWLKCKITSGLFPDEFTVETKTVEGSPVSLFAPSRFVQSDENLLSVCILEETPDAVLIILPVVPFEIGSRTINVDPKSLVRH